MFPKTQGSSSLSKIKNQARSAVTFKFYFQDKRTAGPKGTDSLITRTTQVYGTPLQSQSASKYQKYFTKYQAGRNSAEKIKHWIAIQEI